MDRDMLKLAVVFALVYIALYLLSFFAASAGLLSWLPGKGPLDFSAFHFSRLDWSLWLLPIVGFFLIYLMLPWLSKEFGFGEMFSYAFPALFAIGSYIAFATAVFYYSQNQAFLSGIDISQFNLDYFKMFLNSSFLYFTLGGLGGWAAHMLIERLGEGKPSVVKP